MNAADLILFALDEDFDTVVDATPWPGAILEETIDVATNESSPINGRASTSDTMQFAPS